MTQTQPMALQGKAGRYNLDRMVGRGSHAQIWSGKSEKGVRVAIKKRDPESGFPIERWVQEIALLKRLKALEIPGVIPLVDEIQWDGEVALVFPWFPETLAHLSGKSWGYLRPLIGALAQTLQRLHEVGIVHHDVSLENILVSPGEKQILLADFGLAVGPGEGKAQGDSFPIGGNPAYALPSGHKDGPSEDWHGLAVCAWKLVTGEFPSQPANFGECKKQALAAQVPVALAEDLATWVVDQPDRDKVIRWLGGKGRLSAVPAGLPEATGAGGFWIAMGFILLLLAVLHGMTVLWG